VSRSAWLCRIGLTLLTTISVGALADPAQAAAAGVVMVVDKTKTQYKAAKGKQNRVVVTRSGNTVTVDDRVAIKAGKGCKAVKADKTKVRCTTSKAPTRVRVYTYDRNDSIVNKTDLGMTADSGTGNDSVTGGPRADTIRDYDGKNKIWGLGGADAIDTGDGNDRLYGGDGDDRLNSGHGNDVVYGGNGYDWIIGGVGNDKLYGGAGDDNLRSDAFFNDGPDNDVFQGGSGNDTVDYFAYEKPVTADADGVQGDDGMKGEKDTIKTDVEQIQGGQAGDRLYGTARRDALFGGPGKDLISGYGGNDVLAGELGSDVLNGGAGNDDLIGDNATMGKVSADVIRGGTGRDRVFYDSYTKAVTVDLDGAKGDDGQAGEKDTVGADVEDIWSGTGNDRLTGNASANEIQGGAGNDIIRGGAGNDSLNGDDGRDSLSGEAGDDALSGNEGYLYNVADTLDGGPNATAAGDSCWLEPVDRAVNCER